MRQFTVRLAGLVLALLALGSPGRAATVSRPDPIAAAKAALGADTVRSLQVTAVGARLTFTQPIWADSPTTPIRVISSYRASFDFDAKASRVETELTTGATGGVYVGNQRTIESLAEGYAWNEQTGSLGRGGDTTTLKFQPQPDAVGDRTFWLWAGSPQGVLKAAAAGKVRKVPGGAEVTFSIGGPRPATAKINDLGQVESVRTLAPDPLLGDTVVEVRYAAYRNFDGVQFPSLIVEFQAGQPLMQLAVTGVKVNPPLAIKAPDEVKAFKGPLPMSTVKSQKVAEGVYWITGIMHHSMAIDMGTYAVVVEAPWNEARSDAVIAETKRLIPGKPIRYVVNTHVHFDHSGGLRTYVAAGATVVTQAANRAFYERAWARPRTMEPDRLSKSRKPARFLTVDDKAAIKGANGRAVEFYHLQGNPHDEASLIVWLPAERIVFQSDILDGPGEGPSPVAVNFYENLRRLDLDPLQIVGGHGPRILTMTDLKAAVGKTE